LFVIRFPRRILPPKKFVDGLVDAPFQRRAECVIGFLRITHHVYAIMPKRQSPLVRCEGAARVALPASFAVDQLLADLRGLCAIASIAARPHELQRAADRTAALMRSCGLAVQLHQQPDLGAPPVVVGYRAGRAAQTLLLYHHYDVAASGPWRDWQSEPFVLAERDDVLYGRGVAVGKGPLVAHLQALAALQAAEGGLPCGVLVVAEGQGQSGSAGLAAGLAQLPAQPQFGLASLGEADADGHPFCYSGAKGLLQVELTAQSGQALPGGLSTSIRNPLWRLVWALASIKTEDEAVQVEGFEQEITPLGRDESQALKAAQLAEQARLQAWGLEHFLFEMHGVGLVRTEAALPACNLASLNSEPGGEFLGIPAQASARLQFYLVPEQQPATVLTALRNHLDGLGFVDVLLERLPGGYSALYQPTSSPFATLLSECGTNVWGNPLPRLPGSHFALPLALLGHGLALASVGCAPVDSGSVGANEHVPLTRLLRHAQLLIELLNRV
jgi:acetylornithine deacetylase/succinyl-diaminopimelate desuccinylase-like protein